MIFEREASTLWDFAMSNTSEFKFRTVREVLEENQDMKTQIEWLNNVIACHEYFKID